MDKYTSEKQLQEPLLAWLKKNRRLGSGSVAFEEFPWFGRKVDLVTITQTRRVTAYELKLNGFRRAVEQAAYNRIAFDRTYVVTAANPTQENVALAVEAGVGIIVFGPDGITEVATSPLRRATRPIRQPLLAKLREIGSDVHEPVFALS